LAWNWSWLALPAHWSAVIASRFKPSRRRKRMNLARGPRDYVLEGPLSGLAAAREAEMRILTAVIVVTGALVLPAWADQSDALEQCVANSPMSPQRRLESCTAAIAGQQQNPQNLAIAYDRRGDVYLSLRDYGRASADFDQAVKLDPRNANAFNDRGRAFAATEQFDRAIADFDQAIALDAKHVNALVNRGTALRRMGRLDAAIQDFDRALALNSRHYGALFGRGLAYQDKGRWDFDAYLNEGRYEDLAIRDYDRALELSPKSAAAYNNRALARMSRREYDLALLDYQKAIELDPNNALYYSNRGNIFRVLGRYDRAVADYRKALSIKPAEAIQKQVETALKELGLTG
jgi:tetratricopeptide (TPR) repeat protein